MTAPATALSQITAHIAQLQSLIASVSAPAPGAPIGGSQFAAELAGATAPAAAGTAGSATRARWWPWPPR